LVAAGACDDGLSGTCTQNSDCPDTPATCSSDTCSANPYGKSGIDCTTDADCNVDFDCDNTERCESGDNAGGTCDSATYGTNDNPQCPNYDNCTAQDGDGCSNYDDPATVDVDEALCEFSRCGDGILDPAEGCEIDDSGVTPVILVHSGTLAPGTTCNACVLSTCGANAGTQPGEQCDDGNTDNTDGCTTSCRNAQCGDGIVQVGEECDDANGVETDECTNECKWNVCGDGVRFTEGTPNANTGALQLCDAGPLGGAGGIFTRGRDDGDGYYDQPAFCNGQCEVVCDGTNGTGASLWKGNNWCLMAAEEYPLWPVDPLVVPAVNNLDDATYTAFVLDWDDAKEYCEDLGIDARLVKYDSTANAATLGGVMTQLGGGFTWWLGAYDNFAEAPPVPSNPGRFVWLDETAVTDVFVGGRPDGTGDCAAAASDSVPTGYVYDSACGATQRFFCEYQGPFPRSAQ
jgi:cysteine-rich repeat protein